MSPFWIFQLWPKIWFTDWDFVVWDIALITLPNPFDIGLPYINPICLLPESKGKSKDWDGILFTALGTYLEV